MKNQKDLEEWLKLKNPVSRELDGKPEKAYWVQMQIQMEVWDLDECDFLETVFKSYENEEEFLKDGDSFTRTKEGKMKGVIIQFYDGSEPIYEYPPVDISQKDFDIWYDKTMEKNEKLTWITNVYWYMHDYSCVLVPRNKQWFAAIKPDIEEILEYDIKKKEKQDMTIENLNLREKKKLSPKSLEVFTNNTLETFKNTKINPQIDKNQNIVIKVRTQSFEDAN